MQSKLSPCLSPPAVLQNGRSFACSGYLTALAILFLLTLPFIHGTVDGDGIGYYAYLRSPLIDHNLAFATDWKDPHEVERIMVDHV